MTIHASDGINAVANVSPIETKGNWFWKDGKRFLIKGVTYEPRSSGLPSPQSRINPLSHEWLQDLRKDIPFFHRLGINTIFIECAELAQSPLQAMQLLQNEGIYVLLKLHTSLAPGDASQLKAVDINLERMYSPSEIRKNLTIVRQTAGFSNVLGYTISQSEIWTDATTKLAALHRAAVRDTKLFLRRLGVRPIPVGSSMSSAQMYRLDALRYMTAGSPEERADFMSFGVYDWVGPSGFQMSGYKSLIKAFEAFPVPMFWGEYGASAGRKRVLDEVDCLYSPAMTGVVSGGFLHTYGYFGGFLHTYGPQMHIDPLLEALLEVLELFIAHICREECLEGLSSTPIVFVDVDHRGAWSRCSVRSNSISRSIARKRFSDTSFNAALPGTISVES